MTRGRAAGAVVLLAIAAAAQDDPAGEVAALRARAFDGALEVEARCAALGALQDRNALLVPLLLQALDDECEPLQHTAVMVLRNEWLTWPDELLQALGAHPRAAFAVLQELAVAPRPSVDAWVARECIGILPSHRFLAHAARVQPPDRKEGEALLRAMAWNEDLAAMAVARLSPAVADQLVGVAHELLASGRPVERLLPWFDRLSPKGTMQLLGLASALPPEAGAAVVEQLAQRGDAGLRERVRAAVDGEIPLELNWVRRAGPLLDTPARRRRVANIVADQGADEALRLAAFDALVEAGGVEPELVRFAADGGVERWRRLFAAHLPLDDAAVLQALDGAADTQLEVVRALGRATVAGGGRAAVVSPAVENALVRMLRDRRLAGDEPLAAALRQTLAQVGGDVGTGAVLALARDLADRDPALLLQVYDALAWRRDPIGTAALLGEFDRPAHGAPARELQRRQHLALVLAETGDRRQLDVLFDELGQRPVGFVRRCRHALPQLPDRHWLLLVQLLDVTADRDLRVELLQWLAGCGLPPARAALRRAFDQALAAPVEDRDDELLEVALQGLLGGADRDAMLAAWRATAGQDHATDDLYAFAAVATMPEPLAEADVELLQFLLFALPRLDPREADKARQFADGRTGFPVVAAIAARLRQEPAAAADVCAPARALAEAGDTGGLVRQRFLSLWTALQAMPALRLQVGRDTAALVLAIADDTAAGSGPAHWYLGQDLAERGDHAGAAAAFRVAVGELLRLPQAALAARIHLGVRDHGAGVDPFAALASAPHLEAARAALAAGDRVRARQAALAARDLAGHDAAALSQAEDILAHL